MPTLDQWQAMWKVLGVTLTDDLTSLYHNLTVCYEEPQRRYHTLKHLDECLEKFHELRDLSLHPAEVKSALWFHDAIYDPTRGDNEQRSADYARRCLIAHGVSETVADRVHALVMATRHEAEPVSRDAEILVDADLAILGAAPERFAAYERQVREEYRWVPEEVFRQKRAEILRKFLARPRLYHTARFIERYELQARENLARSLQKLGNQFTGEGR